MAVTGKQRWYLAVLIGNREFKWFVIERDEAEISALMDAEKAFWWHVKNNTPPAVDGTQATTDTIKAMYADDNEDVVDLYMHKTDLDQYQALTKQIKELETLKNEMANRVKAFMGDSGNGECDGFRVSWKTTTRSTFDVKRFAEDHQDIDLSEYYNETSARTFRVTEYE
jgi:predicted phage-related endonuclease